jgi:hypothetical protein
MEERNCSPLRSDLSEVRASSTYFFRAKRDHHIPLKDPQNLSAETRYSRYEGELERAF